MRPAFYIFCLMVVVGAVLYLLDLKGRKKGASHGNRADEDGGQADPAQAETQASCADSSCVLHELCPSDAVLACSSDEIVYYDDEELDAFKGCGADDYEDGAIEQFRDVLYTLKASDLIGWEQSLKKRGVEMPRVIRDEFIMLYSERAMLNSPSSHSTS